MTDSTKPQLSDIAARAGVSLATVDRVINRRKGVKERTRGRVLEIAREIGFLSTEDAERYGTERPLNMVMLLPAGSNPYLRLLGERVKARIGRSGINDPFLRCFFIESFDATALAEALRKNAAWADAIAFFAIEHPEVREAALEVAAGGTRLVTIVSDLGTLPDVAHVGLDNRAVGRTAGLLIGRLGHADTGAVALVAGSRHYRAHSEREAGFLSIQEEMFPHLRVIGMREGHDDAGENYRHTLALLDQAPDLVGIYNVGGSSSGISRALRERDKTTVTFIGHGLTPDTRRALLEGSMDAVFDQDPDLLIEAAIRALSQPEPRPRPLRLEIYFRENLP
ncbi:LacI family DNA-binding transcriptional regulator [Mameliella alba]|uniref:LacI family DNA-binding transcriptional regulator n=1 Tax=Mameliella alba TaxID=561184 RepID=UPI000B5328C5|nr:LacI family DNA-binding transcriptional regulator [Mameliella alba]MBY6118261.1 LacI family DNA-binding transcriptional regulator [Mameliella alba]OWV43455.1 LacI family transcriptional regulator [Mameliella alba]OWV68592.1 LacI family transcriptional regulator [Mameliella alba]